MLSDTHPLETQHNKVQVGDRAPAFTLPDQHNHLIHFEDLLGTNTIVLYFYPKDFTGGCTAEACAFRDSYEVFKEAGATVIGVSSDSVKSHQEFAQHHQLPFILLSDAQGRVQHLYGVRKTLGLFPGRVTFIIDRRGTIRHIFSSQINIPKHIADALQVVQTLQRVKD